MSRTCRCWGIVPVLAPQESPPSAKILGPAHRARSTLLCATHSLALAVLVGFSAAYAQEPENKNRLPVQDEGFVLEITDKHYNEETGDLSLMLRNNSDLTITAYGVSLVFSDREPRAPTGVSAKDMFPGDGIAPGASREHKIALGDPSQYSARYSARAVKLHHEIRSDNTSYGDTEFINNDFEQRTAYFVELERALTRLRRETSGIPKSVLPLLKEEAEEGKAARQFLTDPYNQRTQRDGSRLSAVASIGSLAGQTVKMIENGHPAEQAVAYLDQFLEDELANASRNIRPADLERYER